jgi:hypothetical protein
VFAHAGELPPCNFRCKRAYDAGVGASLFAGISVALIARIAERGLEPTTREEYANGVRKAIFRDADGNEIGFGGGPA